MNFSDLLEPNNQIENVDINTYAGKAIIACRTKFKGIYGDNGLITMNLISMVDMLRNHDYLASYGYFITDENREDKYIEILEKDDPKLLSALEQYITYFDTSVEMERVIREYKEVIEQIKEQNPDDVQAINAIIKPYLDKWIS